MDMRRLWRTFRLWTSKDRSEYIRRSHIFASFGEHSTMSSRKIPLYPELISIGNNVRLAANVSLVSHDMIHAMLNNIPRNPTEGGTTYREYMGCIRIDNHVFVGANSTILADVHIGSDVIIGAGTLVTKDLEGGFVYAGVPAKKICSFDEFVEKRKSLVNYSDTYSRNGDSVEADLAKWLWNDFNARRKQKGDRALL